MNQTPMQQSPAPTEPKQPAVATWLWIVLIIVVIAAFLVYWFYLR